MNEIWLRLKMKMPTFFKRMFWLMVTIGGLSTAIVVADMATPGYLPALVVKCAGYGLTVGIVGGFLSKLTVKDAWALKEAKMEIAKDKAERKD